MINKSDITQPMFSIVIPSRNEPVDIAGTLEACLALEGFTKEIIVVDDSSDNTPEIVKQFQNKGVKLIHRSQNENGCCGARNIGMQEAKGQIIILINADDRPKPDFLTKIKKHYDDGADYLIVKSVVLNRDTSWSKFIWASALQYLATNPDMQWSEGFSCRKDVAKNVGYIPGDFPVNFCRDYMLGTSLAKSGYKKHTDLYIDMGHIAPSDFHTFWSNRVWRGTFSAPTSYYFMGRSIIFIEAKEVIKILKRIFEYVFIVPFILRAIKLSEFSPTGWKSIPGFIWIGFVQDCALAWGGLKGIILVRKNASR